jgi:hypothetical protein
MKLNNTDIRTVKVYNPSYIGVIGITAQNGPSEWRYLLSGTKTPPSSISLQQGVYIRNTGKGTDAVISIEGFSAGTANPVGTGVSFSGYVLPFSGEVFLPVDDIAKVIVKSTSATTVGITFSYIAT